MSLDPSPAAVSKRLGPIADATAAALAELAERDAVARLWAADHTLWRDDPTEISDRLGWLSVVPEMVAGLDAIRSQCAAALAGGEDADDDPVEHVLLMGMGGSSLFPEVVARSLGGDRGGAGRPRLHVVDTTDPAAIRRIASELPPDRTLHIAASKSGTTLETRSHLEWAWSRHPDPRRFAVITDPGSELADLARERGFVAVWENRPDIGGRYSALSHFGIVPALLTVPDVAEQLLLSASAMAERLRAPASANAAAQLAATLAAGVRAGRDKVTVVVPDEIASGRDAGGAGASSRGGRGRSGGAIGLWLEQLLAESTGKDGTGVVPVVGEPVGDPGSYGDDRLFVVVGDPGARGGSGGPGGPDLDQLAVAGHPVYVLADDGPDHLGGQVLLWEVATALTGALLGIHPFDQPDVAAAKAATEQVLAEGLPHEQLTPLPELLDQVRPGDYLAIQAFVDPGSPVVDRIEAGRRRLRDRLRVATTVGLGPRFLHSTGQLHKGGPGTGVFVQVVGGRDEDEGADGVPIPGRPYDFATLERAQAAGDLLTLRRRGRRAGRVDLDELLRQADDPQEGT